MRLYAYVGQPELLDSVDEETTGTPILTKADSLAWISDHRQGEPNVTATYVIDEAGILRLADRRSEHVHCSGGRPVLSAGEITFDGSNGNVLEVTNQSTGFCPEPESWPSVAAAMIRIGTTHLTGFTSEFVFRLCPVCGERNIVRDGWFVCAVCDADLPQSWNFQN
jgi:hypothetical protein